MTDIDRVFPDVSLELANQADLPIDDLLKTYMRELGTPPRLSHQEEQELAALLAAGRAARRRIEHEQLTPEEQAVLQQTLERAEAAQQRLVAAHLPLVVALARRYANAQVPLLDLIQEGNLALLQAIEKFDPQRGVRLASYAAWWIKHAIHRALADQGRQIRLPASERATLARLHRAYTQLVQQLGREPNEGELAEHLGIERERVLALLPLLQAPLSLDAPVDAEGDAALEDMIADTRVGDIAEIVVDRLVHDYIRITLSALSPEEQRALTLRYGLDDGRFRSLEEVARLMNMRRERVRQIESRALRKLRHPSLSASLADMSDEH